MTIKSMPSNSNYLNNYGRIFKKAPMNKFTVPVDFTIYAEDTAHLHAQLATFLKVAMLDIAPSHNVTSFELPVGYPEEPDESTSTGLRDYHI